MTSQIPETPPGPPRRDKRTGFWLGVSATVAVIVTVFVVGPYLSLLFSINFGNGIQISSTVFGCDQEQVTVLVDADTHTVGRGEARIFGMEYKEIGWKCGNRIRIEKMTCHESTEFVLIVRYPDDARTSITCETPYR